MDPRTRALLEAPIVPTLLRLALPNVAVMGVQSAIGLIETWFVAKLGTDALAGMALVFPLLMVIQMISAGAMGGGILSSVARALGSNRGDDANMLAWHAVAIAVALGVLTTAAALFGGPKLYALMGGRDGSLAAALTYSNLVFLGAIPLWLYNSLAAVIRGTGNMIVPASVTVLGAIVLLPLSPALIFGLGPLPRLGIAGGAAAVVAFYVVGSAIFATYLWAGRGVLRPSWRPPALRWAPTREILRIGAVSSLVSVTTNVSIATATGLAGVFGPAAVAGYGTGARLEYLLVPLVFGLGAPLAAMVGTAIGAGRRERAVRVAWIGAAVAGALTEAIGLAAARLSAGVAVAVLGRPDDERGGRALSARGRAVLRFLRHGACALLRVAGRGPARLAAARRRAAHGARHRRRLARRAGVRSHRAVSRARARARRVRPADRDRDRGGRLVQRREGARGAGARRAAIVIARERIHAVEDR